MSIYSDALTALQRALCHGGELTFIEKENLLACIRAGAASGSAAVATANTDIQAAKTSLAASDALTVTQAAAMVTQWGLVDVLVAAGAPGYAALVTGLAVMKTATLTPGATAATAVHASKLLVDTAGTSSTAAVAAVPAAATLIVNPVMDGAL